MNSELRILHVITNLKMGGAERLTIDICSQLAFTPNILVTLVLLENEIEYDLPTHFNTIILKNKCSLSLKKPNSFENSEFESILLDFKPHIIHSHLFESEIISRYTLHKNIRYFTHVHDNIRQFKPRFNLSKKKNLTELFERWWIFNRYKKTTNKFISISRDTTNYSLKYLPKKLHENIFYLPNSIDTSNFSPSNKLPTNKLKLIAIGSLVKKKNHTFLIDVVNELIKQQLDVELSIVGDGKLKKELALKIENLNLQHFIHLLGNRNDISACLANSDVFVHSATYEPFGLVLLEAMASGTPIVSIDGKGNKELITNYENGFILDKPSPLEFAEKIVELYSNKQLYKQLQNNGIEFSKQFDIKNYVIKLLNIYKS
ncbi:MAG: glycosyltransferase [Crocinitomicaceae bacterium]|jgi:glycosyltransferase involved in cell wall biosynthesis